MLHSVKCFKLPLSAFTMLRSRFYRTEKLQFYWQSTYPSSRTPVIRSHILESRISVQFCRTGSTVHRIERNRSQVQVYRNDGANSEKTLEYMKQLEAFERKKAEKSKHQSQGKDLDSNLTLNPRSRQKEVVSTNEFNSQPEQNSRSHSSLLTKTDSKPTPRNLISQQKNGVDVPKLEENKESGLEQDQDWQEIVQEGLEEKGIQLPKYSPGTYRILCPSCDGGSTREESLGVTIDGEYKQAIFHCFRATCGFRGRVTSSVVDYNVVPVMPEKEKPPAKPNPSFQPLDEECLKFFQERRITKEVLDRNNIQMEIKKEGKKFVAFPYYMNKQLLNVKYRGVSKKEFHQVSGAAKIMYGMDDVKDSEEVIIVEGEMDKLALEVAGYLNVLSVPDGAPGKVRDPRSNQSDTKFSYLKNSAEIFENVKKVILATDNDECGKALAEELSRRLGIWKCWKVKWPTSYHDALSSSSDPDPSAELMAKDEHWFRKDANEVLVKDGVDMLRGYMEELEPYPVNGLYRFYDYYDEIRDRFLLKTVCPSGFSIGWPGLDRYYKVVPGELTVVSGVPNSGKSEWLDAVAVKLAEQYGWTIAFASMEKIAWDHGRQLIEKHVGKPFFSNVHYAGSSPRMSPEEVQEGLDWINDKFPLIQRQDDDLPTVEWILDKAKTAVLRFGIRGLVIDPYNELDHGRKPGMSETEFVSKMLSRIKNFARVYDVHVWLVAHPRQLHDWKGEPPNLYDISGSAHFVNKADCGIVVHRNWQKYEKEKTVDEDDDAQYIVQIIVRKMRNKAAGKVGTHVLRYNPVDGTYFDPEQASAHTDRQLNGDRYP